MLYVQLNIVLISEIEKDGWRRPLYAAKTNEVALPVGGAFARERAPREMRNGLFKELFAVQK